MSIITTFVYISTGSIRDIRQDERIQGVKIKNEVFKLRAFADDMVISLESPLKDIELLMTKLNEFGVLAGFKVNKQKTKILTKNINTQDQIKLMNKTGFKVEKKVRYLGINLTSNNCMLFQNNYVKVWKEIRQDFVKWERLKLSLMGRISVIKMNVLPKMLFLFQTIPIILSDEPFKQWQREISKYIWQGKKPRIKFKILQDAKERGGLDVPDLKVYYAASAFVWLKEWLVLRNKRLLNLEGSDLRFGWHAFLWYDKIKANLEFKNHYIRQALLRIWNKYKNRFYIKMPLWISPQEAFFGRHLGYTETWLLYKNLLVFTQTEYRMKTREELQEEGFNCQWFQYRQLLERFKVDKKMYGFEESMSLLESQLCLEEDQVISKMYRLLLKYETEEEQVKDFMIYWARNIGHEITMDQWENLWTKRLKFTLNVNIKENFYKMMYRWYLTPVKLAKIYEKVPNRCWKCKSHEGTFYHMWWTCPKAKKYWILIHKQLQLIFKVNVQMKPEAFLLGLLDDSFDKSYEIMFLYMTTAARILYAKYWKVPELPSIEEWWMKILDFAEMDKLTILLKEKSVKTFMDNWKPFIDFLRIEWNMNHMNYGFDE